MSQLLSQALDPIDASISIAKFSHNTCPYGTQNFVWTHVANRNDLDFIVRRTRVVDEHGNFNERLVMKISAGAELLEIQDLGQLVQFCEDSNPSTGAENQVQLVVKCPFIAMRYPRTPHMVRRLQVKFHNDSDFDKALSIMQEIGLPITDSVPSARPPISQIPSPALSTSSTGTAFSTSRPASANSSLTPAISGTSVLPAPKSGFKIPIRPDSSCSNTQNPHGSLSNSAPSIPRSTSISSAFSVVKHTTPALHGFQVEKESQSQQFSLSNSRQILDESFPSSLKQSQGDGFPSSMEAIPAMETGRISESATNTADAFNQSRIRQNNLARPASNPNDHSINKMFPFSYDSLSLSRPQSTPRAASISILPPLPKPTLVARTQSTINARETSTDKTPTPTLNPAKRRVAERKSSNVTARLDDTVSREEPQPENLMKQPIIFGPPAEPEDELSPLAAKSAAAVPRPPSIMASLQSKATTTKKRTAAPIRLPPATKRPRMVDQSTQTQTLSGRDHTTANKATPVDDVSANMPTNVPALVTNTLSPPESYLDAIDNFVAKHKGRPAPKEIWETPGYAEADEEQRLRFVNDFICENLENADFIQLVKDTEKSWRRIGLGM